jgi:hypothetical protein
MLATAAGQGFYGAATQIIPILLLVLFLGDGRVIRADIRGGPEGWRSTALLGLGAIAVMLLGELAALRVVAEGHDSYFLHGMTVLALVYGFTFIFAQAAKLLLLGEGEVIPPARQVALGRLYMVVVILVLVGSLEILDPGFLPF